MQKNIEDYKSGDSSLITELKQLRSANKDLEYCLQTIRAENKKENELKNKMIEKMNKTLFDIQGDTKDICAKYDQEILDKKEHIKQLELFNSNYLKELEGNKKDLSILNEELLSCRTQIEELHNNFEEYKIRLEYKDCVIENIKDQNLELINELGKIKIDQEGEQDYQIKLDTLSNQLKVGQI